MAQPVSIHADVHDRNESARGATKNSTRHNVLHRGRVLAGMHIEIENFFPHGYKKTQMPLLARVFLRDLQLDGRICFLEAAEERRHRLPHLEVNRSMFDLDDHVVVELAVERMEVVVRRACTIVFRISPIEMVVVDKRTIEDDAVMRRKGAGNYVGGIGRRPAIGRGTEAALRIRLDDNAGKIRNQSVNVVKLSSPPFANARICRIERVQTPDHLWTAEVDRDR